MKKYFTIILLAVIAIRPMYYVGLVAYYETHINEIIEKYCVNKDIPELKCNGKCHLAKQIATPQNNLQDYNKSISKISFAFYPLFFQEIKNTIYSQLELKDKQTIYNYSLDYSYLWVHKITQPPRL